MRFATMLLIVAVASACLGCNIRNEMAEKSKPSFSGEEANAWLGMRVRCIRQYDPSRSKLLTEPGGFLYRETGIGLEYSNPGGFKCPGTGGRCFEVAKGELGTVTEISQVPDGGYFLIVRWDDSSQDTPMLSYFGRKTSRLFLERCAVQTCPNPSSVAN